VALPRSPFGVYAPASTGHAHPATAAAEPAVYRCATGRPAGDTASGSVTSTPGGGSTSPSSSGSSAGRLELNDIGRITLRTSAPVLADRYADDRVTGAFILIDEHTNDTVGAGMIEEARERHPVAAGRRDVTWHDSELDREQRWEALKTRGATVWLTGLPASGKSTIAVALERKLSRSTPSTTTATAPLRACSRRRRVTHRTQNRCRAPRGRASSMAWRSAAPGSPSR
jgi:hypothetical protein